MTTHDRAFLQRPEARGLHRSLRQASWLTPFLESEVPSLRRLGARLLIDEILAQLKPAKAVGEEVALRHAARAEGRKRAAALYMAGFSFVQIARELGVSESKAGRWARQGRSS